MTRSRTLITSHVLLVIGTVGGAAGMITGHEDAGWIGLALTALALPVTIGLSVRAAQQASEAQLAEADNAGYRRALDHVARGLLNAPVAPTPGHPEDRAEQAADNVTALRPHAAHPIERKAQ
ncbi:hypothetical protein [Streptomyces longwoodensis]|uniref:hypothetical protein n=1 Tax=Streptomyces longwoodensis TaxID=68231 RepID=UPI0036FB57E5